MYFAHLKRHILFVFRKAFFPQKLVATNPNRPHIFHRPKTAVTEMVPDLILAPDFFGPREIWSPRNLVLKKFGPHEVWASTNLVPAYKCRIMIFLRGPNFIRIKFLGTQISWGQNLSKPKFHGDQKKSGDISVIAS